MILNARLQLTEGLTIIILIIAALFFISLPFKIWYYRRKVNKKK